jgi:hypothetical protein
VLAFLLGAAGPERLRARAIDDRPADPRRGALPGPPGPLPLTGGDKTGRMRRPWQAAQRAELAGLREAALLAGDPRCAGDAIRALGRLRAVADDAELLRLIDDPRPNVRDQVILALGESGRPDAIDVLVPFLHAADPKARILATQAVGSIGGPRADAMLEAIHGSPPDARGARRR